MRRRAGVAAVSGAHLHQTERFQTLSAFVKRNVCKPSSHAARLCHIYDFGQTQAVLSSCVQGQQNVLTGMGCKASALVHTIEGNEGHVAAGWDRL